MSRKKFQIHERIRTFFASFPVGATPTKHGKEDLIMEHINPTPVQPQDNLAPLGHQPDGSYVFECRWCHRIEVLTPEEVQWYLSQNFVMPTRCAPCRRKRRGLARHYAERSGSI